MGELRTGPKNVLLGPHVRSKADLATGSGVARGPPQLSVLFATATDRIIRLTAPGYPEVHPISTLQALQVRWRSRLPALRTGRRQPGPNAMNETESIGSRALTPHDRLGVCRNRSQIEQVLEERLIVGWTDRAEQGGDCPNLDHCRTRAGFRARVLAEEIGKRLSVSRAE